MLNFSFLTTQWPALHEDAAAAEANIYSAPRTCAFYARRTLEKVAQWMYAHDSYLEMPYQETLAAMIYAPKFKDTLAPTVHHHVRLIHKLGNSAVHSDIRVNVHDALQVTRCLHQVLSWFAKSYSRTPLEITSFDESLVPRPIDPDQLNQLQDKTAAELQTLQDSLAAKDKAFTDSQKKLADTEEQVEQLRAEIQSIKAANKKTIQDEDYTETQTRDLFIDLLLREAGWDPHGTDVGEYEVLGMPK